MTRIAPLALVLLGAACATAPPAESEPDPSASVRLLDVQPSIGSLVRPNTTIHVRAEYRLPRGAGTHQANLMFLVESGALVSAARVAPVELSASQGVIELSAVPGMALGTLRRPLTAVVMIMASPADLERTDTVPGIGNLPPEVRARVEQIRDSSAAGADSLQIRTIVTSAPRAAVVRSRAIFFNGAGPAPGLGGPLPFSEVIEEYQSYGGHKAFALAVDENGRRTWGYSFGLSEPDSAIARALRECGSRVERRGLAATCRIYAVNDQYTTRAPDPPKP